MRPHVLNHLVVNLAGRKVPNGSGIAVGSNLRMFVPLKPGFLRAQNRNQLANAPIELPATSESPPAFFSEGVVILVEVYSAVIAAKINWVRIEAPGAAKEVGMIELQ